MARKLKNLILVLLLLISSNAYATNWVADVNCEAAWLMDIDEDPITDSSGNGNTGALRAAGEPNYDTTTPCAAYSTGYYVFDGSNDDITVSNAWGYPITITHWVNLTEKTSCSLSIGFVWASDFGFLFKYLTTERFELWIGNVHPQSIGFVSWDVWMHIGVIIDGSGNWETFKNGVSHSSGTETYSGPGTTTYMGGETGSKNFINGDIDETAIFSTTLTSTNINDIMDNGLYQPPAAGNAQVIRAIMT